MKILILGAGKMGLFFADLLSPEHEVAIFDSNPDKLRFTYNVLRFSNLDEVDSFEPELVLNAATVKYTIDAFEAVLPHIGPDVMLSDIASVKTDLPEFYKRTGHPFVSTHPMFGPTFASLANLAEENAIIIKEGDWRGQLFFEKLYRNLNLNVAEYTFEEHDEVMANTLTIPFASTLLFGSVMKPLDAPGTTYKRHLAIARGLMSEEDHLLTEIMFNPHSLEYLSDMQAGLETMKEHIRNRDSEGLLRIINSIREKLTRQK